MHMLRICGPYISSSLLPLWPKTKVRNISNRNVHLLSLPRPTPEPGLIHLMLCLTGEAHALMIRM